MRDLVVEINSNITIVNEKRKQKARDTNQFIRVLCDDVRQFLSCMVEELT
jgi:hypothetical protein